MSTNVYIAYGDSESGYRRIYVHSGCSGARVPEILLAHYQSEEDAKAIVGLGDLSCLKPCLSPFGQEHSFRTPEDNVTVAYHRDRADPYYKCSSTHFGSLRSMEQDSIGFVYVFTSDAWYQVVDGALVRLCIVVFNREGSEAIRSQVTALLAQPGVNGFDGICAYTWDEGIAIQVARFMGNAHVVDELESGEKKWVWPA